MRYLWYKLECTGQPIGTIFFLDSNVDGNSDYDKTITSYLYGGDRQYRLMQEIVLGIGGIKMLDSLGYNHIKKYHMSFHQQRVLQFYPHQT